MPSIKSLSCVLPKVKIENQSFFDFFPENHIRSVENVVGVNKRYWSENETSLSLCCDAAELMFEDLDSKSIDIKSELDLLIFVTQTPDRLMPAIAYEAHSKLKLPEECACYTLNAGCTGFVEGIGLAFDLMQSRDYKNCLLLVGDTLSKHLDKHDPGTAPIFGDAGTAVWIENNNETNYVFMSGTKSGSNDSIKLEYKNGTEPSFLKMNGIDVFNFTINGLPKFIKSTKSKWLEKYNIKIGIDYYFFHQANNMILKNIIKKLKLDENKVPMNIEEYGNTSGATIPLVMSSIFNEKLKGNQFSALLCGFGVGLSWASILIDSIQLLSAKINIKE